MAEQRDDQHDQTAGLAAPPAPEMDPATQSLADALRVSFRLLTGIMVLVVIGFLLTGFKVIPPQEIGIKKVFGRVVGTADPGLAYTWPFPIGQIETVATSAKKLTVYDFMMHETAEDKIKDDFSERSAPSKGLRPGWDGALFTGDRNLLHVEVNCHHEVPNASGAKAVKASAANPEELVRSHVCRAVVKAAAERTADDIKRAGKDDFAEAVRREAQGGLNDLTKVDGRPYEAIHISKITIKRDTWPLRALRAYGQAQRAVSERNENRNQAIGDARKILNEAAGANYEILVGKAEEFTASGQEPKEGASRGLGEGLIGQYLQVKDDDPQRASQILQRIEQILVSSSTGGRAAAMINEAKTYRTQVIQGAESRAERFDELLAEYEKNPQFWLERRWADTRDGILSSPTIEKYYLTVDRNETVLIIGPDPKVRKGIQRELLKKETGK